MLRLINAAKAANRLICAWLIAGMLATTTGAQAQDSPTFDPGQLLGPHQAWSGIDASEHTGLFYSGVTFAPFSETMHSDGWRIRIAGGYGRYAYEPYAHLCPKGSTADCRNPRLPAITTYIEALAGYQFKAGDLTTKVFVGIAGIDHDLPVITERTKISGSEIGPKAVIELWLDIGSDGWTSVDLSATTAHNTAAARWRGGWRMLPQLSVGPEARLDLNADGEGYRAGLFASYTWESWSVSLAGGFGSSAVTANIDHVHPYATLNLLKDF